MQPYFDAICKFCDAVVRETTRDAEFEKRIKQVFKELHWYLGYTHAEHEVGNPLYIGTVLADILMKWFKKQFNVILLNQHRCSQCRSLWIWPNSSKDDGNGHQNAAATIE